ncbi:DUF2690 domain-containing protein [Streptosporangium sp. NPDC004379]|uniref:DUF2690 domain-containing protein n=1 Tax=Streptosporangium sp. NPDC004379 TaxID=3366189 RepID=UPI00369ABB8B
MRIRTVATALAVAGVTLVAAAPANAQSYYDHKDPYRTGCGNTARVVKKADITSRANGTVGTVRLMWSSRCKTNWTEISVSSTARGSVRVYTNRSSDTFRFKAGNHGRHWGNMLRAPGVCAWGAASIQWGTGAGGQNGAGVTAKACR